MGHALNLKLSSTTIDDVPDWVMAMFGISPEAIKTEQDRFIFKTLYEIAKQEKEPDSGLHQRDSEPTTA